MSRHSTVSILAAIVATGVAGGARAQSLATLTDADLAHGRDLYQLHCGRCHGQQGGGGEGPTLAKPFLNYARDDASLVSVIQRGIPGTAMVGNTFLSDVDARQIAGHLRSLGRIATVAPPGGNATRGEQLFRGRGGCTRCHGANAAGGPLGPGLVQIGARRSAAFIRQSISDPGAALPVATAGQPAGFHEYVPVDVTVRDGGESVRGHRVNESTFTILVRDRNGTLHSFDKSQLDQLVKRFGQSLMPSYRSMFNDAEIDDLVAYLIGLREFRP